MRFDWRSKPAPGEVEQFLMQALDLETQDIYRIDGLLDPPGSFQICAFGLPDAARSASAAPTGSGLCPGSSIFNAIRAAIS